MDNLMKRLADLLKIKNIITLMATVVFVVLALDGRIGTDNVMLVVGMVFTYFFNKDIKDSKI
ncbi:MAG: hypothetical protein RR744_10305 [Cellulosilyticaceae bacterium]